MPSEQREDEADLPTWVQIVGPRRATALEQTLAGPLLLGGVAMLGIDFFVFLLYYDTRTTGESVFSGQLFGVNPAVIVVAVGVVGIVTVAAGYVILVGGGLARHKIEDS